MKSYNLKMLEFQDSNSHLVLDLTDSPNLNYPAYQKNAQSLLNLNKCKSESCIPTCFENLTFIVFFQVCIDLEPQAS